MKKVVTEYSGEKTKGDFTITFRNDDDPYYTVCRVDVFKKSKLSRRLNVTQSFSFNSDREFKDFVDAVNMAYQRFMDAKYPEKKEKKGWFR